MKINANSHILLATRNQGKIRELAQLLAPFNLDVVGLDVFPDLDEVEETGTTFSANALLKACAGSKATGLVALADDSGLEVDALDGAPGVYSARYSEVPGRPATDASNVQKLLNDMKAVAHVKRTARFRCCMAACTPYGDSITVDGRWEGILATSPAGDNGFGYDPIFFDPELQCTAAQMNSNAKNSRSHRGKAVQAMLALWPEFWQTWISRH